MVRDDPRDVVYLSLFFPSLTICSDLSLEKSLQKSLEQARTTLDQIMKKLTEGQPVGSDLALLSTLEDETRSTHPLLQERFRVREEEVKSHGANALRRQEMVQGYSRAIEDYLGLLESLSTSGSLTFTRTEQIRSVLHGLLPKRKRPILGGLPYRNPNYPAREPNEYPPIKSAYKGGSKTS